MESTATYEAKTYKVLVGIDFSPASAAIFLRALEVASRQLKSEIHAVIVTAETYRSVKDGPAPDAQKLHGFITDVLSGFTPESLTHLERVVVHHLTGAPAQEIIWLAANLDADLIVVGTHGRTGVRRLFLGSVSEHVVRAAGCPVLVVRDKQHDNSWKVPEIEPPCKECLAARLASNGEQLWCERHSGHMHTHVYSSVDSMNPGFKPWGF